MTLLFQCSAHSGVHHTDLRGLSHLASVELRCRRLAQLARPKRFGDVIIGPAGHSDAPVGTLLERGQQNHRGGAQRLQHRKAVHHGHLHITVDKIWTMFADQHQTIGAVVRRQDIETIFFKTDATSIAWQRRLPCAQSKAC